MKQFFTDRINDILRYFKDKIFRYNYVNFNYQNAEKISFTLRSLKAATKSKAQ